MKVIYNRGFIEGGWLGVLDGCFVGRGYTVSRSLNQTPTAFAEKRKKRTSKKEQHNKKLVRLGWDVF